MSNDKKTTGELIALIKARNTLIWIPTREEKRAERLIESAAKSARYAIRFWDCATGLTDSDGEPVKTDGDSTDERIALATVQNDKTRCVYVFRDVHPYLKAPTFCRAVKSLARTLRRAQLDDARSIIILSATSEIPEELTAAHKLECPLPDREDMGAVLSTAVGSRSEWLAESDRDAAIDAVLGLTEDEAEMCYAKSIVLSKRIDPSLVAAEKKSVVTREGLLEWYDPDPRGFDAIGGLDLLKPWSKQRKIAFTQDARAFGLPAPKGVLVAGISGCGKSLFAKAIASELAVPLVRMDFGALKSKYVGESEQNVRRAFAIIEALGSCVLWLDEIEKAFAGVKGPQGDGGVATDAFGAFLTWRQECKANVFVVATANDVSGMPPEFSRKGRFDEAFFVDLPNTRERTEILSVTLRSVNRDPASVDLARLSEVTATFTGSEVASIVADGLFPAYAENKRALTTDDLELAASKVVPLAKTSAETIATLREWAKTRARPASSADVRQAVRVAGALDVETN